MTYSVEMTPEAIDEIETAYQWMAQRTEIAPAWYNEALDAMILLEKNPERWPIDDPDRNTRKLLFGNKRHAYKIIFTIRGSTVYILHMRHSARHD